MTRAQTSRYTSSSRGSRYSPSRYARSRYPSRAASYQSHRQSAAKAALSESYRRTGQAGLTQYAASLAGSALGFTTSFVGVRALYNGVGSHIANRRTPSVIANNRYGSRFELRTPRSPLSQNLFSTRFSRGLPNRTSGHTGFKPDDVRISANNARSLNLVDSKAVLRLTMSNQMRNYASAMQSGMLHARSGMQYSVGSVTIELGRPRLGNTTTVSRSVVEQGFNFVDGRGRPITPSSNGSITYNHGTNWSAAGRTVLRWGGRALVVADPLMHGMAQARQTPASSPWHERWTNGIIGAAQRVDNVGVAGGSGTIAAGATSLSGPGAFFVGAGTAIAVGTAYENTPPDRWFNRQVDRAQPIVSATLRGVDTAGRFVGRTVSSGWSSIRSMFNRSSTNTARRTGIVSNSLTAPIGRGSSARIRGQRGSIRLGHETNAFDVIAHRNSFLR